MAKPKKTMPAHPQRGQQQKRFVDPRTVLPGHDSSGERISWRFSHIDNEGPWGWMKMDAAEINALVTEMVKFESMTIRELFQGYPGKDYEVPSIPNREAQNRLVELGLADMTRISTLRINGPARLYGFRVENVFHVVWWDPTHEVWPVELKHT